MRHVNFLLIAALGLSALGCNVARPQWRNPGPVQYQQAAATYHDPYPSVGSTKNMDDTRPRDYDRPYSETIKTQDLIEQRRVWGK